MMKKTKSNNSKVTTVTFLDRKQLDYLDKLGKDCFFTYGRKLSRSRLLSELVTLMMNLGIRIEEINLEKSSSLWEAILKAIKDKEKIPSKVSQIISDKG